MLEYVYLIKQCTVPKIDRSFKTWNSTNTDKEKERYRKDDKKPSEREEPS